MLRLFVGAVNKHGISPPPDFVELISDLVCILEQNQGIMASLAPFVHCIGLKSVTTCRSDRQTFESV